LLLLTEAEASRLAGAVKELHVPRSLIILEAVQAGLQTLDPNVIPGRRTKSVHFRLPPEVREKVRLVATQYQLSQQNLIRHMLFAYLAAPPWNAERQHETRT
jgi:hypothetical protein